MTVEEAERQLKMTHSGQDIEAFRTIAREEYAAAQREPVVSGDTTGGGCETVTVTAIRRAVAILNLGKYRAVAVGTWNSKQFADELLAEASRQEARDASN